MAFVDPGTIGNGTTGYAVQNNIVPFICFGRDVDFQDSNENCIKLCY